MCGLAGIVTRRAFAPESLTAMSDALAHRGPDGEGFLVTDLNAPLQMVRRPSAAPAGRPVLGLAHRRLSIIDLSTDNDQPLVDAAGGLAIAFNGEIYNYRELRTTLEAHGHVFRTTGDTEVALLAFAQWGPDCFERFNGMWALAICDRSRRRLVLSRDRFGIKPLYWHADAERLVFASEIKSLFSSRIVEADPDEETVARYLVGGRVDTDERTFFSGVRSLPAATTAVISLDGGCLAPSPRRYWSSPAATTTKDGAEEQTGVIRRALEESIVSHLRSDVPVGTCLSGGIDSSGIVCVASHLRGLLDPTYTHRAFGYVPPEPEHSERPYMEAVAGQCGVELTYAQPTESEFRDGVQQVIAAQDEPFGSASIAAQWFVFAAAAQAGIKVMLDGQGADEVFGGYHHYLRLIAQELVQRRRARELAGFLRDAAESVGAAPYPRWIVAATVLPSPITSRARDALLARARPREVASPRLRRLADGEERDPLVGLDADAMLRADIERFNLPGLLRYEDRNSMAHSIEARVPYLDHRLVEAAFCLPAAVRMAGAQPKRILRDALADVLPAAVRQRRDKVGFRASPTATRALAQSLPAALLEHGTGVDVDWLSRAAVRHLLGLEKPSAEEEFALWRVVNIRLWARRWWD